MLELAYPDPPLAGAGIRLRALVERDIPAIVAACQDPVMQRFIPGLPVPYGEAEARWWLEHAEAARQAGISLDLAVVRADDDTMIGSVGADLRGQQRAECGYWMAPEARGRGHGSAALTLLCDWLFDVVRIERVELTTAPDNVASQRLARAAGFSYEGYSPGHWITRDPALRRDSLRFGRLAPGVASAGTSAVLPGLPGPDGPGRIVWLNGPFGGGKTSTAQELKRRRPQLTVYDPEYVGFSLREWLPVPTGDFQDLPEWRECVVATGASLARHRGTVLAPMTLWRPEYLTEIFAGLHSAGVGIHHVLLDAPDAVIAARLDADPDRPADARAFAYARLVDYSAARAALRAAADTIIDTARLDITQVCDEVLALL